MNPDTKRLQSLYRATSQLGEKVAEAAYHLGVEPHQVRSLVEDSEQISSLVMDIQRKGLLKAMSLMVLKMNLYDADIASLAEKLLYTLDETPMVDQISEFGWSALTSDVRQMLQSEEGRDQLRSWTRNGSHQGHVCRLKVNAPAIQTMAMLPRQERYQMEALLMFLVLIGKAQSYLGDKLNACAQDFSSEENFDLKDRWIVLNCCTETGRYPVYFRGQIQLKSLNDIVLRKNAVIVFPSEYQIH